MALRRSRKAGCVPPFGLFTTPGLARRVGGSAAEPAVLAAAILLIMVPPGSAELALAHGPPDVRIAAQVVALVEFDPAPAIATVPLAIATVSLAVASVAITLSVAAIPVPVAAVAISVLGAAPGLCRNEGRRAPSSPGLRPLSPQLLSSSSPLRVGRFNPSGGEGFQIPIRHAPSSVPREPNLTGARLSSTERGPGARGGAPKGAPPTGACGSGRPSRPLPASRPVRHP